MSEEKCSVPWNNRKGLKKSNSDWLAEKVQKVAISVFEWEALEAMKKVIVRAEKTEWKEALSQVIFCSVLFVLRDLLFSLRDTFYVCESK